MANCSIYTHIMLYTCSAWELRNTPTVLPCIPIGELGGRGEGGSIIYEHRVLRSVECLVAIFRYNTK